MANLEKTDERGDVSAAKLLSQYEGEVATLGAFLRQFLLTHLHGITEQPDVRAQLIGYGYGEGYRDLISTIMMSKKGIKLGFYRGSELPDPKHLLTGSGKLHRYVPIHSEDDIRNPALLELLGQAVRAHRTRTNIRAN